ncbi:hypothetical protein DIPPA_06097 [Diplonema papillatum]|nr:hypothetical protein DIPPA_06097 [Diplonema papillatum]
MNAMELAAAFGQGSWVGDPETRKKANTCLAAEKALWRKLRFRDRALGTTRTVHSIRQANPPPSKRGAGHASQPTPGEMSTVHANNLSLMFLRIRTLVESLWEELHVAQQDQTAFSAAYYYPETPENYNRLFREIQHLCKKRDCQEAVFSCIETRESALNRLLVLAHDHGFVAPKESAMIENLCKEVAGVVQSLRHATYEVMSAIVLWRRVVRLKSPFIWKGRNYITKMQGDVDAMAPTPLASILSVLSVDCVVNPLLLPRASRPAHVYTAKRAASHLSILAQRRAHPRAQFGLDECIRRDNARKASLCTPTGLLGPLGRVFGEGASRLHFLKAMPPTTGALYAVAADARKNVGSPSPSLSGSRPGTAQSSESESFSVGESTRTVCHAKYAYPSSVYAPTPLSPVEVVIRRLQSSVSLRASDAAPFAACDFLIHNEATLLERNARCVYLLRRCLATGGVASALRSFKSRAAVQQQSLAGAAQAHIGDILPDDDKASATTASARSSDSD